jgi:Mycothiol maleylpyruvate isomerase N-terminal domain
MTTPYIRAEIGALLATLAEEPPTIPAGSVVQAALAARPKSPLQTPPVDNEVAAFGRAVDDVQRTLDMLEAYHWPLAAVNGLSVGELVGHLIGTQQAMAAELGIAEPISDSTDHIEATRSAIDATAGSTPTEAARRFASESATVIAHLADRDAAGLAAPAHVGLLLTDVRFLLIARVFELWTHDNDLRAAIGWARVEPDPDRLWMMTRTVMPLVGGLGGHGVRVVLTGAGGGVWEPTDDEVAEVVVDAASFCRRVANRLAIDDLDAEIGGDPSATVAMLTALATLALD